MPTVVFFFPSLIKVSECELDIDEQADGSFAPVAVEVRFFFLFLSLSVNIVAFNGSSSPLCSFSHHQLLLFGQQGKKDKEGQGEKLLEEE
jgi:hypothetical protein